MIKWISIQHKSKRKITENKTRNIQQNQQRLLLIYGVRWRFQSNGTSPVTYHKIISSHTLLDERRSGFQWNVLTGELATLNTSTSTLRNHLSSNSTKSFKSSLQILTNVKIKIEIFQRKLILVNLPHHQTQKVPSTFAIVKQIKTIWKINSRVNF